MRAVLFLLAIMCGPAVWADIVVPARNIRAREVISADDLIRDSANATGAVSEARHIVGLEAKVVLYAGRPIRVQDVGPPAVIDRNELVTLVFSKGPLRIVAEGRSLNRGAVGETVRAMNKGSRMMVTGIVTANGQIEVQ